MCCFAHDASAVERMGGVASSGVSRGFEQTLRVVATAKGHPSASLATSIRNKGISTRTNAVKPADTMTNGASSV